MRPKAAVAANVGSGPDIIIGTIEDAQQYPDKLVDVTDLANYLGNKYGGWYDAAKAYATHGKQVDRDPDGLRRQLRSSTARATMKAAGLRRVPARTWPGFLKLCQALEGQGHAARFRARQCDRRLATSGRTGCVWAHGGKMVDEKNNVVINSPETIAALEYAKQLYETFVPGTLSWLDPNNNKAFLDGQISLTANGISSTTRRRPRRTRSCRKWPRTSSTPTSRSAPWASRPS